MKRQKGTRSLPLVAICLSFGTTLALATERSSQVPDLPIALTNNAVAAVSNGKAFRLYSFYGLESGKRWRDISRRAYEFNSVTGHWITLPSVPVSQGRLASVAAVAGGQIYLFGGYTVSEKGEEVSTADVLRFDPKHRRYAQRAPIPIPVDDSVTVVYRDRWIVLISGWHEHANVSNVQIYDRKLDQWSVAADWPGAPVFGHAAALIGDTVVVCDGVRLDVGVDGKRRFTASNECWRGDIQGSDPTRLAWSRLPSHPGAPRYRMGAAINVKSGLIMFAGGSENPYNYDGIGYDGTPSEPSREVDYYDIRSGRWSFSSPLSEASMDHRGFPCVRARCFLLGGMRAHQRVSAAVIEKSLLE